MVDKLPQNPAINQKKMKHTLHHYMLPNKSWLDEVPHKSISNKIIPV
jgi:hypothetical protein